MQKIKLAVCFLSFFFVSGLEDNTTGSVADTVASVFRGCIENMPKGEPTTPGGRLEVDC